jgi:RND family efflux transporter MFP subunit
MILNLLKKKKTIILIVLLIGAILLTINYFNSDQSNNIVLYQVDQQDLIYSLSETGTVKRGEEVVLSFNQGGRIIDLPVRAGDEVVTGQTLASLEKATLLIELESAQEGLVLAQSEYQRLLAGLAQPELYYYEVALANAKTSWENAQESLIEIKAEKQETEKTILAERNQLYNNLINSVEQSINIGLDSLLFITDIQQQYFSRGNRDSLALAGAKTQAVYALLGAESAGYWNKESLARQFGGARKLVQQAETDAEMDEALGATTLAIEKIRLALDVIVISELDSLDLSALSAEKTTINVNLSTLRGIKMDMDAHLVSAENRLSAVDRAIQTAERSVKSAQGSYQLALAQREMKNSPPREEDQGLYLARIRQAESQVKLIQRRLKETVLTAPFNGSIVYLAQQSGEIAHPGQPIVKVRPTADFQIEAEIYEGDIGRIKAGQQVEISLVAFPEKTIFGSVALIDPQSRIINNVVYYPVSIELEEEFEGLRVGLTADVSIVLEKREDVLIVPREALIFQDQEAFVEIKRGEDSFEKKKVVVGLEGDAFRVEIISGLEVGDQIIAR